MLSRGSKTFLTFSILIVLFSMNLVVQSQFLKSEAELKMWSLKNTKSELEQEVTNNKEKAKAMINAFD